MFNELWCEWAPREKKKEYFFFKEELSRKIFDLSPSPLTRKTQLESS